jgi:hypothetical protein
MTFGSVCFSGYRKLYFVKMPFHIADEMRVETSRCKPGPLPKTAT